MDRVYLRDAYGSSNYVKPSSPRGYTRRISRLPTPETSGSGCEPYDDDDYQEEILENERRLYQRRLQPPNDHHHHTPNGSTKRSTSRRDSCNQRSPNSPLYRCADLERPSLPPLRTILADGISSPPSTPNIHNRSFHPSPKEPTYISSTYKPPALYPHKKQRTNAFFEPVSWINQSNRDDSLSAFRTPIEPYVATTDGVRRDSFSAPPVQLNPYLSSAPRRCSNFNTPTTPSFTQRDYQRVSGPNNSLYSREDRPESEVYREEQYSRDREQSYDECYKFRHDAQYELVVRPGYSEREGAPQVGPEGRFNSLPSPNMVSCPYTGAQPALFIPGHGEYLSRSRKRSNLPKESTDIMKQWFDLNISNPYPSEEQKAIFATATRISMNQVSNWFINHRRRCPELRDKREKAKGREP